MNAFAGFGNWSPVAGFILLLLAFSQHFAFIWCFSAFISWHTACINKQQEAKKGRSMDLQCPLLFFVFLWIFFCRIMPPCNSVPTNWIKRTSLESQTPSWCFTEATRMAREFVSCFCYIVAYQSQEEWRGKTMGTKGERTEIIFFFLVCFTIPIDMHLQVHYLPQDGSSEEHTEPCVATLLHPC